MNGPNTNWYNITRYFSHFQGFAYGHAALVLVLGNLCRLTHILLPKFVFFPKVAVFSFNLRKECLFIIDKNTGPKFCNRKFESLC